MQTKNQKSNALHLPANLITDFHFWYKNVTTLHCHDCYELFIMTKGTTLHTLNDAVDKLEKNTVGIIRPGEQHQFSLYPGHKSEHICIGIQTAEFLSLCNLFDKSFSHNLLQAQAPLYFTLNEKEFQVVILHAVNGIRFKEIARLTGGLESSVRWQYNNALKKIKKAYEGRNA